MKPFLIYCLYIIRLIICIPVLPVIYYLGVKIKRTIPDLPEAFTNIEGFTSYPELCKNILLVGESSISAVGIEDHNDGIPGEIGRVLKRTANLEIAWKIIAKSGFRAKEVIENLLPLLPKSDPDLIILGMGGNDTFKMTSPWIWRRNMKTIVRNFQDKYPGAPVIICAMPPVADFPVFPPLLRSFMGGHTNMLRHTIFDFPKLFENLYYLSEKVEMKNWLKEENSLEMADFFSDGVHPSALTYQLIGRAIAEKIMDKEILQTSVGQESGIATIRLP